jgi:hypothetical protein
MWLVHRIQFLIIKPTRCTSFSNLFLEWNSTCSDSFSVHHQEFFTVHTAMVHVIQICWQQAVSKPVWQVPLLCVQWKSPDDGQRNCPKHVEFYSKNKFEKLLHLVSFILRKTMCELNLGLSNIKVRLNVSEHSDLKV